MTIQNIVEEGNSFAVRRPIAIDPEQAALRHCAPCPRLIELNSTGCR